MTDDQLIDAIVARAALVFNAWYPSFLDEPGLRAMIVAAHAKYGIRLTEWLAAPHDTWFLHDVIGLRRDFDLEAGELTRGRTLRYGAGTAN